MNQLIGEGQLLNSTEAERGAENLIAKVEDGSLRMDVLPNSYSKFSGKLEEEDYISYCRFIKSVNGKNIINMLEDEDAREYVEL